MYYIGIDGGGTKTAFSLIDSQGMEKGSLEMGTCHFAQVGVSGFKSILKDGMEELLKRCEISLKDVDYIFLGIPGYGEIPEKDREMVEVLQGLFPNTKFSYGNDAESSWAGSLACEPGISIVAGTGAIAYGRNSHSQSARSSGWGDFCGDEGSAHWIAKKGIEYFGKQADYRHRRGPLYEVFTSRLNLKKSFDLIDLITIQYGQSRTEVAKLSKLVYEAAILGDEDAISIFREAAREHLLMIKGVLNQLDFQEKEISVSYTGGVFSSGELVLTPLKNFIEEEGLRCRLMTPLLTPVRGSALYAMSLSGAEVTDTTIKNLKI